MAWRSPAPRSVGVRGWIAEECEAAALERLADATGLGLGRDPSKADAVGRGAALDELRRLTGWRRRNRVAIVPVAPEDMEQPGIEPGYESCRGRSSRTCWLASLQRLRPRDQVITLRLASGSTGREIAAGLGVSPSIVSVALRRISERLLALAGADHRVPRGRRLVAERPHVPREQDPTRLCLLRGGLEPREELGSIAVPSDEVVAAERVRRAPEDPEDVGHAGDRAVGGDRHLDLRQADAALRDAIGVSDDLGGLAGEFDLGCVGEAGRR